MTNGTTTTVVQPAWVDSCGNIRVNGRSAMYLLLTFQDQSGNPIDVSKSVYSFEVDRRLEVALSPVLGQPSQQQLFIDQDGVASVGVSPNPTVGPRFVLRDVTSGDDDGVVVWEGMFIVRGFTNEPVAPPPGPPGPPVTVPPRPPWVSPWVPISPGGDVPMVAADFANGQYWNGFVSSTDPMSLFTQDNGWGSFSSADITPGLGLACSVPPSCPVLLPTPAAPLLGGLTALLRLRVDTPSSVGGFSASVGLVLLPGGDATRYEAYASGNLGSAGWQTLALLWNQQDALISVGPDLGTGLHGQSVNLTFPRVDWATDGTFGTTLLATAAPSPAPNAVVLRAEAQGGVSPSFAWITSATFWTPQPIPDLPAISTMTVGP